MLIAAPVLVKAQVPGVFASQPFGYSPSYRVEWATEAPGEAQAEEACGFDLNVEILESADTIGARVQLRNRRDEDLYFQILPEPNLQNFLTVDPGTEAGFRGRLGAGQVFSLLWGFDARKEDVLRADRLDFSVMAERLSGREELSFDCRRRVLIQRVRDGIVFSRDRLVTGFSLGARQGPQNVGAPLAPAWGLDFGIFDQEWGAGFAMEFLDFGGGSDEMARRLRSANSTWRKPELRALDVSAFLARRASWGGILWTYDLGLGFVNYMYGDGDSAQLKEKSAFLSFRQRLAASWPVRRFRIHPFDKGEVHLGVILSHQYVPSAHVLGLTMDGHALSTLATLRFSL